MREFFVIEGRIEIRVAFFEINQTTPHGRILINTGGHDDKLICQPES